ncbi:hypothetical protein EVAR_94091_1 [Eumeta japonica]|uniref:Uncharacterized protein n=1 Tax=Eumeta variegata TaxID=151549 RepID=A0A4C1V719_EUMVA|nr:hypothetical protein EVAR_94091_1 [Eumeta japonica]
MNSPSPPLRADPPPTVARRNSNKNESGFACYSHKPDDLVPFHRGLVSAPLTRDTTLATSFVRPIIPGKKGSKMAPTSWIFQRRANPNTIMKCCPGLPSVTGGQAPEFFIVKVYKDGMRWTQLMQCVEFYTAKNNFQLW